MRVSMAICAPGKLQTGPTRTPIRSGSVTFCAGDLSMGPSQREVRFGVIEIRYGLPIVRGVATFAARSQASLVRILVTRTACCWESQKRPAEVFHAYACAFALRDASSGVTSLAGKTGMFTFQWPSRFRMIESFNRRVPTNQREGLSVVFRMATRASLAAVVFLNNLGMKSLARRDARRDLSVALQAFVSSERAEFVAGNAIGRTIQGTMRLRKGSGRDLRDAGMRKKATDRNN